MYMQLGAGLHMQRSGLNLHLWISFLMHMQRSGLHMQIQQFLFKQMLCNRRRSMSTRQLLAELLWYTRGVLRITGYLRV